MRGPTALVPQVLAGQNWGQAAHKTPPVQWAAVRKVRLKPEMTRVLGWGCKLTLLLNSVKEIKGQGFNVNKKDVPGCSLQNRGVLAILTRHPSHQFCLTRCVPLLPTDSTAEGSVDPRTRGPNRSPEKNAFRHSVLVHKGQEIPLGPSSLSVHGVSNGAEAPRNAPVGGWGGRKRVTGPVTSLVTSVSLRKHSR